MRDPLISVVMAVHNGADYLREAIESILNQTYDNFEFIIIDDASTDDSPQIIEEYMDDHRIKIITNKVQLGLTKSLNIGISIAKGEFIARQDSDDVSLPERFEMQIDELIKDRKIGVLGTGAYIIDQFGNTINVMIPPIRVTRGDLLSGNKIIHGSAMIRRAFLKKLGGGYNPMFKYSQDYELWLRTIQRYDIRNIQCPLYLYRIHNNSIWGSEKKKKALLYALFAKKYYKHEIEEPHLLLLNKINENFIEIYALLDSKDKIEYHMNLARLYLPEEPKRARDELFRVLKYQENMNHVMKLKIFKDILLTYFGKDLNKLIRNIVFIVSMKKQLRQYNLKHKLC